MLKMLKIVTGISLLVSSAVYANQSEIKNHVLEKINIDHKKSNILNISKKPYHHTIVVDGYKTMISSIKPLKDGKNDMTITILKNKKPIKNAMVNIKFSMPSMPGMEFTKKAEIKGNKYNTNINFSMHGEWAYELIFKTSDGSIHKTKNSVHIK